VGVPLGLALGVVHLAHLVQVHERVQGTQVDAGEGTADGKPSPSSPEGEVVTETTGRSVASGPGRRAAGRRTAPRSVAVAHFGSYASL
jgi:hypothetical protein